MKRIAAVFALISAIFIVARVLNSSGNGFHRKWFFEYHRATSTSRNRQLVDGIASTQNKMKHGHKNDFLSNVPVLKEGTVPSEQLLQTKKCPICFGTDLCKHIENGVLELDQSKMIITPGKPRKISYNGALHTSNAVVAKTLVPSEFTLLEQHICLTANENPNCDVSKASEKLLKDANNLLQVEAIQHLHKNMKKTRSDIPVAICTNKRLLFLLKKAFHEEKGGEISQKEQLMLYSTLASSPELVILKFLTDFFPSLPFTQYYGSCGRMFFVEGAIAPLKDFLTEPFHVRASLGAQILQMIEDFTADEDSEWFVMFTDFSFDNLGVNKDGEVVIIDVEDMVLVDKMFLKLESEISDKFVNNNSQEPCNEHCLRLFTQQVLHSASSSKSCAIIPRYSHLMYAVICQKILSYLEEHRVEEFYITDPYKKSRPSPYPGLLHNAPSKDKGALEELLQECVQETAPGGRLQAAEELKDYLSEFFKDDDGDEEDAKNDSDEYEISDNAPKV